MTVLLLLLLYNQPWNAFGGNKDDDDGRRHVTNDVHYDISVYEHHQMMTRVLPDFRRKGREGTKCFRKEQQPANCQLMEFTRENWTLPLRNLNAEGREDMPKQLSAAVVVWRGSASLHTIQIVNIAPHDQTLCMALATPQQTCKIELFTSIHS